MRTVTISMRLPQAAVVALEKLVFGNKDEGPVATPGALDAAIIEEGGDEDAPTIGDQGQTAAATLPPHRVFDRVVVGCAIEVSPVVVLQYKTGRFFDGSCAKLKAQGRRRPDLRRRRINFDVRHSGIVALLRCSISCSQ